MPTKTNPNAKNPGAKPKDTQQEVNKTEAVKAALNELGRNAQPLKIQSFVKEKFGMDLKISLINNYKYTENKKSGKANKPRVTAAKAEFIPQAARRTSGKSEAGFTFHDLQTVKDLKSRLGVENLRSLINLPGILWRGFRLHRGDPQFRLDVSPAVRDTMDALINFSRLEASEPPEGDYRLGRATAAADR